VTLTLSDADLARLRLECYRTIWDRLVYEERPTTDIRPQVEELLAWCLRPRPTEEPHVWEKAYFIRTHETDEVRR